MKVVLLLFVFLVVLRVYFFYSHPLTITNGEKVSFTTTLLSDPTPKGGYQQIIVPMGNFWHTTSITLFLSPFDTISYGQTIHVLGKVKVKVLNNKSIVNSIYLPQIKAENNQFLAPIAQLRQKIIRFCEKSFSQTYSSLLIGILLGVKTTISNSTTTSYRITGMSHILVVDGMKITLVAGFLIDMFAYFLRRRLAIVFSILSIGLYMMLSGLEISAVRAGSMSALALLAQLLGRQYTGLYTLFILATLFLLWDPSLLQSVAFQLSVLSTAGIIAIKPFFKIGETLDDIGITLSAQLATLPILFTTFGSYPLTSLPVHLLTMWTVPLIMILAGLGVGISFVFTPVGHLILLLCAPFLWYFQGVVEYFARFNLLFQVQSFPWSLTAGYYCLLLSLLFFLKQKRSNS